MATHEATDLIGGKTLTKPDEGLAILEQVVVGGDLAQLSAHDRLLYYTKVCESVGLNPFTRPLEYITLNGRLTLYAAKNATDQLRDLKKVSITRLEREFLEGLYIVTAYALNKDGRTDSEIGAVPIEGLKGEARANAIMKCVTKAKRRVTLSICGLGMLDETEVDSIPTAQKVAVDPITGALPEPSEGQRAAEMNQAHYDQQDRDILLGQMKGLADTLGLKAPARATLLEKHNIRDPRTCDLSSLQDLLTELRGMKKA